MFRRVLIANRGEIAVRIIRTCRALGVETVAVYSDADRRALHVLQADSAMYIGPSPATDSYLNIAAVIDAARESGAEAVHPGYGLLSENAALADACGEAGLAFVGPPAQVIRAMGDKAAARGLAARHGVPVIPGYDGEEQDAAPLLARAREIGFPVMIKAAAGGGGRGMRLVESPGGFEEALESARREAQRTSGDGRMLLERAIMRARHVEVQVLGDTHGNAVHLGERDCSIQRRHQKVVEESPAPAVDDDLRRRLGEAAVEITRAAGYVNAGTVEFLLDADRNFYFMEMNTRLQVEHGVTELVTGQDLVALQLAIAAGEALPFGQGDITFGGHAVECRVYAEDPLKGYLPSPGHIAVFDTPSGEGVRNDVGTYAGDEITTYYDPLLAKVLTWGRDRPEALQRMHGALAEYRVEGVKTNLALLRAVVSHPVFQAGGATTTFLEAEVSAEALVSVIGEDALLAAFGALVGGLYSRTDPWLSAGPWRTGGMARVDLEHEGSVHVIQGRRAAGTADEWAVTVMGRERRVRFACSEEGAVLVEAAGRSRNGRVRPVEQGLEVEIAGRRYTLRWSFGEHHHATPEAHRKRGLASPMPGLVLKVMVRAGEHVRTHQTLVVLEAMKMEHAIEAPYDGKVTAVHCAEGGRVAEGVVLIELEQEVVA
ncbi:MAG: acetyl-CoA carboxylase biotin carboxylase subunit [Dehalococcoidia bacterium]|nr:acetyl-CoA carboxylase biotin carboxylase subunit [Dehalococcoidia bacterium]